MFTIDAVMQHLRMDDSQGQDTYLLFLIDAATAHAEQVMACSLLTRTVTASFYEGENLYLPRGPIQAITSVQVNNQTINPAAYSTEQYGHSVLLRYQNGTIQPHAAPAALTVTYTTGYGDDPNDVPSDIQSAVLCHIGLLFENREVAQDRTVTPVPFLDEFYRLRSLEVGIG
jgi:uncharacterized phiE125 gp8 family phage protein